MSSAPTKEQIADAFLTGFNVPAGGEVVIDQLVLQQRAGVIAAQIEKWAVERNQVTTWDRENFRVIARNLIAEVRPLLDTSEIIEQLANYIESWLVAERERP